MSNTQKHFVITVNNPQISKCLVAANIQESYKSYLIAEASAHNPTTSHRVYVESFENEAVESIRKHFEEMYNARVDVEPVSDVQKTTRYITQQDMAPILHNISNSMLSFGCQVHIWAKETQSFNENDPFVRKHQYYCNFLRKAFEKIKLKENVKVQRFNETIDINDPGYEWKTKVAEWWNSWMDNGWFHRKKQLFLWGPKTIDKMDFINKLLNGHNPFRPVPRSRFAYEKWDEANYGAILIDNFDKRHWDIGQWKLIAGGEGFVTPVKYEKGKIAKYRVPFIILSNNPPPYDITGFIERVEVVFCG